MANKMLIDATHPEETRVVVLRGNRVEEFDFESAHRKQLRGNIYLAKVTRVEPSLQAAFVDYGGNRHGFLAFSEIHPDYYQIPIADRQALIDEEERAQRDADDEADRRSRRHIAAAAGVPRQVATTRSCAANWPKSRPATRVAADEDGGDIPHGDEGSATRRGRPTPRAEIMRGRCRRSRRRKRRPSLLLDEASPRAVRTGRAHLAAETAEIATAALPKQATSDECRGDRRNRGRSRRRRRGATRIRRPSRATMAGRTATRMRRPKRSSNWSAALTRSRRCPTGRRATAANTRSRR